MQINHNIRAMVTQHALYQNNNAMTKSLEKLSTGLKINRAQDDAAGLAMSEQMRTQIRGLGKAKQNAQDGQAALQIAEGGLQEITNLMQRQRELANQAANDTLTATERKYLNDEFQSLTKEVKRIAESTDYNGKNVLIYDPDEDKSFGATKLATFTQEQIREEMVSTLERYFGGNLNGGFSSLGTYGGTSATANTAIENLNKAVAAMGGIVTKDNAHVQIAAIANTALAVFKGDYLKIDTTKGGAGGALGIAATLSSSDLETVQKINKFLQEAERLLTLDGVAGQRAGNIFAAVVAETSFQDRTGLSFTPLKEITNRLTTALNLVDGTNEAAMDAIFGKSASDQMKKDINTMLNIDVSKLDKDVVGLEGVAKVMAWQRDLKDLQEIYRSKGTPGYAASDVLHVGPNYTRGLGGAESNELKVKYAAIDVRGLGLNGLSIDSQKGASKAIDQLDNVIKVASGNRAAIGTYINRLDYTINNIANLEFNTQDAEGRIRDTDFSKETTNFTRNQIMVQASTSMLAQANSLPQAVLGLLG